MADPLKLPPGATLVTNAGEMKLPPGATLAGDTAPSPSGVVSPTLTDPLGNEYKSTSPADAQAKMKFSGFKLGPPAQTGIEEKAANDNPTWAGAYAKAGKSILSGSGKGIDALLDMPRDVYHAFADTQQSGETVDPLQSPLERGVKRLVFNPMKESLRKGREAAAQGRTSEAIGHSVAGGLPVVGAFAEHMGEAAGEDPVSALSEGATYALVPKIVGEAVKGPRPLPSPRLTTPTQESAFNVLHPENAVAKESILPEARNAAAQQGVTKVPKGRAGVELPQKVLQESIDNHEAQVQAIKTPYRSAAIENTAAADAALRRITPEMRNAAGSKNPRVAAKAQAQIDEITAIADRARGANTIDLTDQLRHSWNDELNAELSKSEAAKDVSPAATQAKRAAATALRKGMYDRLADLSGREDVRALAQREGALIEAKAGVTKTANAALKSRRNDLGAHPRIQAAANAAKKINLAKPATTLSFLPDLVRSVIDPASQTPAGQYAARVQRAFGDLGAPEPSAPLYATPTPAGLLPAAPIELGPSSAETPGTPPPPVARDFTAQRVGVTPPNAGGAVEHVPYESQANATELPSATRVPRQIGAGPDIRGLLPQEVEGAIGLPEKSQSTLTAGRTIESPAANEGVVPGLVRDFINSKTPGENPDVAAMKSATTHNSPAQAAAFNERGAQEIFGRPYETLSVPERLQAIRRGTELQTAMMKGGESTAPASSGHNSITNGSLEEISRGKTLKVNPRTGAASWTGGNIDIRQGEAVLRQRPDGTLEVVNNNSGVGDSELLDRFIPQSLQTFAKPGRAPGTVEMIHNASGAHGDVPMSSAERFLKSGDYRLAPRHKR